MKIPRIAPGEVRLTEQSPNRRINRAELSTAGEAVSSLGSGISDIAGMFEKAQAIEQKTRAQNHLDTRLREIELQAAQDTDSSNEKRNSYIEETRKARQEAGDMIYLPVEKSAFALDAKHKAGISGLRIQNEYRKKTIDSSVKEANLFIASKQSEYAAGSQDAKAQAYDKLNELVAGKIMSESDAKVNRELIDRTWDITRARYEIESDPEFTEQELRLGADGIFANIDADSRLALIKEAGNKQKRIAAEAAQAMAIAKNKRADEIIVDDGKTITDEMIRQDMATGAVDPAFGRAELDRRNKPKTENPKSTTFNKLTDNILDPGENPEKIRLNLIKENSKGTIDDNDFKILYTFNQKIVNEAVEEALPKKNFLQAISFWSDENAGKKEEIKALMFKEYMQKINNGEAPESALISVIEKQQLNLHPEKAQYKIGDIIPNSRTGKNYKVIGFYPDGEPSVEEIIK